MISGPGGSPGSNTGAISVDEGTTTVTQLGSDKPVTWSITGGNDQGLFTVAADGTISFVTPPDFEAPADSDTNNTYILTIQAVDTQGNVSEQTITVTVNNLDDTAPVVMIDGNPVSSNRIEFSVLEGTVRVTTLTSDEQVTWSIVDGDDLSQFTINETGAIQFNNSPDYELPTDSDGNNVYVLAVEATDVAGNISRIFINVTVLDHEELQQKVDAIADALRSGLRAHALVGLSDLLSYNESLMLNSTSCASDRNVDRVSGSANANENSQRANLQFQNALTACGKSLRMLLDGGATISNLNGNSRVRAIASVRLEKNLSENVQIGASAIGSSSSDTIDGISKGDVSDIGGTLQLYGRAQIDQNLQAGAFIGVGRSWYDFDLQDGDLAVEGKFKGNRFVAGGLLRGEVWVGDRPLMIDMVLSHATENLGNARFDATFEDESARQLLLNVGTVNRTRISIPLNYSVFGPVDSTENGLGLTASAGALCENKILGDGFGCGYQGGLRIWRRTDNGSYAYLDVDIESAADIDRIRVNAGYAFDIGLGDDLTLAMSLGSTRSSFEAGDTNGLITLVAKR